MAGEDLETLKNLAEFLREKLTVVEEKIDYLQLKEIAEYNWVYTEQDDYKYLHSASYLPVDVANWGYGRGMLDCGFEVNQASIPGIASRMSIERCPECCESQGMPYGIGSPKNDKECRDILGLKNNKEQQNE